METYHLGIDLHQKFSYWTLMNQARDILFQGKVITKEKETLKALNALPVPKENLQAAIEPVSQWGWYAELLEKEGVKVKLVNVAQSKLIASSRLKNDKVDSTVLAELLRTNFLPEAYLAPRETRELREFMRWRMSFVTHKTRIKNRIHAILWKHGFSSPRTDLFGKKGRAWLLTLELRPIFKEECASLLRILDGLMLEIEMLNAEIQKRAKLNEETKLLMTMPGIGPSLALVIQAEIGDFSRFSSPEKLASYSGLISSSRSSGGKLQFGGITRSGSKYLRTAMVEAACQVRPKWETLHTFYEKIKEKKGNKTARVALARKMLCILWCMVKNKEPFRAQTILGNSGGVKR